jgi:hypothetical protein
MSLSEVLLVLDFTQEKNDHRSDEGMQAMFDLFCNTEGQILLTIQSRSNRQYK